MRRRVLMELSYKPVSSLRLSGERIHLGRGRLFFSSLSEQIFSFLVEYQNYDSSYQCLRCDIRKPVVAGIPEQHVKIDSLVTSAGFCENFEAISYPVGRLQKLWDVNVNGTYFFATAIARRLIERKRSKREVKVEKVERS